jgi:HlyD family secretion protein
MIATDEPVRAPESGEGFDELIQADEVLKNRRRRIAKYLIVAISVLTISTLAFALFVRAIGSGPSATIRRETLTIASVEFGTQRRTARGTGRLIAQSETKVASEVSGRVIRLLVHPGDKVEEGSVLISLANREIAGDLEIAQAELRQSEENVRAEELHQRRLALEDSRRLESLRRDAMGAQLQAKTDQDMLKLGLISDLQANLSEGQSTSLARELELEESAQAVRSEEQKLAITLAQNTVDRERARLNMLLRSRDALDVKSPVAGEVQQFFANAGDWVEVGEELSSVSAEAPPRARLMVSARDVTDVKRGDEAIIRVGDNDLDGTVFSISPVVEEDGVAVEIAFDESIGQVGRSNMRISGAVILEEIGPTLWVKRPADLSLDANTWRGFVVSADEKRAERRDVTIGVIGDSWVEVKDGLDRGERVVVSGPETIESLDGFNIR